MPAIKQKPTFLAQLDDLPPYICFLLARKNRQPITQEDIAKTTGWSIHKVSKLCNLMTWAKVPLGDIDRFREACGITRANERRHRYYAATTLDLDLTANGFAHLRKIPGRAARLAAKLTLAQVAQG